MHLSLTFNDRRRESVKLNVEFWINNESLALSYVAFVVVALDGVVFADVLG